jgi:hypothetical protein
MQFQELPENVKQIVRDSKYYSCVELRIIIDEVLEESLCFEDFRIKLRARVVSLISDARDVVKDICD